MVEPARRQLYGLSMTKANPPGGRFRRGAIVNSRQLQASYSNTHTVQCVHIVVSSLLLRINHHVPRRSSYTDPILRPARILDEFERS
jgi:hypothetical protein